MATLAASLVEPLAFNGVDALTGDYLLPPLSAHDVAQVACGVEPDRSHVEELRKRHRDLTQAHFGLAEGRDPKNLAESGWAVVFAHDSDPAIREALAPLLNLRREQASSVSEKLYRECTGAEGYRRGETKLAFLARHGAGPGTVDPEKFPYYVLIVGDPETIPFTFQYQIDVQYAVGRIHFDTVEQYAAYAQSVVNAECGRLALPRRAAFFGVANEDDAATQMSARELVDPLAQFLASDQPGWRVDTSIGAAAKRARLQELLGGEDTPAFLFTASHGLGFPNGHALQPARQGALLCQEWPGPKVRKPVTEEQYFAANHLGSDARLLGLISMHFACYGAGTPKTDEFAHSQPQRGTIAPRAFVASLPRRLLSHPKGGALAVIGHVERAWGFSFRWERAGAQIETFRSTLKRLMEGHPVGSALEKFNERYAELSSDLSVVLEDARFGAADDNQIAGLWMANNDARSYAIIGDPAVRLQVADNAEFRERPILEALTLTPPTVPSASAAPTTLIQPLACQATAGGLAERLEALLARALAGTGEVQVSTSSTPAGFQIGLQDRQTGDADQMCVLTRVEPDGNASVYVRSGASGADPELLRLHSKTVEKALAFRTEVLKLAASYIRGTLE